MRNAVAVQSYAALLIDAGKANDAIKVASTLLDKHEDNAEAMEVKGRVLASAGRADEAMALINKAIGLVPEFAGALQVKANLLQNAGDLGGALKLFDKAAAADFDNPNYAYQAAKLVNFQGNRGDAMARLRRITEQEPGHIAASNDFAWYLAEEEQDLELALKLATRVTERQRDANTIDTLGWVQYKLGSIDEAVASFKSALELQPDSASIRYRLGLALAKAGSSEQARAELEQAINGSAFPELSEAKAELARLQGS
jgi:Flp pilus assembly protein TadD